MKFFKKFCLILLGFLTLQGAATVVIAGVNAEAVLLQKINQLKRENKNLSGQIEQLQQRQKLSEGKIKELFSFIKYQKNDAALSQHTLKINQQNKQAKALYTRGRDALGSNQYAQAIQTFKQYLKKFPDGNVADAQYWLAKSYLKNENFTSAQVAFLTFQKKYPQHHKLPNALFDLAKIYLELQQQNKAIQALNVILDRFPTHSAFNEAKSFLREITPKSSSATSYVEAEPKTPKKPQPISK